MLEKMVGIGMTLILIGFVLVFAGLILSAMRTKEARAEGGFVLFIGPLPIIGATTKTMFYVVVALSLILLAILFLLPKI